MPEHTVEYHVHTALVGFVNQLAELGLGAEMRVDFEIVVGEIACRLQLLAAHGLRAVENRG